MLSGYLPFKIIPSEKVTKNIYKKRIKMFKHFSKNAENLIKRLLEYNPKKRITFDGIIKHPFFKGTNWDKIEKLETNPPFIPEISEDNLFQYFDSEKDLYDEYAAHEKGNRTLNNNDNNILISKDSLFDLDSQKDNLYLNSEYNEQDINNNSSLLINNDNDCKYVINLNNENNNDNNINEDEDFNNYRISDLNNRNLIGNANRLNIDNYYPGFSFSTSDEEENKV